MSKIKKYVVFIIALLIFQLVSPNLFFILGKNPVSAEESINNELLEVPEGYIGIHSKSDLNKVRDNLSGNYILMNDIDLTEATIEGGEYYNDGAGWTPIGTESTPFKGIFDGNGHQIIGMNISNRVGLVGLFGASKNATILDLGIVDSSIKVSNSSTSSSYYGGIVGKALDSTIEKVYSRVDMAISITSNSQWSSITTYAGGVAGYMSNTTIKDSFTYGNLSIKSRSNFYTSRSSIAAGSISGYGEYNSQIDTSYSIGRLAVVGEGYDSSKEVLSKGNTRITNSYYLNEDIDEVLGNNNSNGRSVENMLNKLTYEGFNFEDTWVINDGSIYPFPTLLSNELYLDEDSSNFAGGMGTIFNPYKISTPEQLDNVRNYSNSYFILQNDIDLSAYVLEGGKFYNDGQGWHPIGTLDDIPFTGSFDGDNFKISSINTNITAENKDIYVGLFGYGENAIIKNLGVVDGNININFTSSSLEDVVYAGSIAGYLSNSKIINSYSNNILNARSSRNLFFGGLSGYAINSHIENSYNSGDVSSNSRDYYAYAGGISGFSKNSTISEVYNSGKIETISLGYAGGIVGSSFDSKVSNSFNIGSISAGSKTEAGGLAGRLTNSLIEGSYNIGNGSYWINEPIAGIAEAVDNSNIINSYYLDKEVIMEGDQNSNFKRSKEEMLLQSTYEGFDFNTLWTFQGNKDYKYPELINNPLNVIEKAAKVVIKTEPKKVKYLQGEEIDVTGAVLLISTNYNNEYDVEVTSKMISGYDSNVLGEQKVYINYDNYAVEFYVTVVERDVIAPAAPIVNNITDLDTQLTGTAEPDATVIAKVSENELGRSTADSNGNYTITINKQKSNSIIEVIAIDAAGNTSNPAQVQVSDQQPAVEKLIGENRYSTAEEVSKLGWSTSETVFLVNGGAIADGLTATPLASAYDAPILLTTKDALLQETLNEVKRLKAKKIIIIGGTGVISANVENTLKSNGLTVSRIGGQNRYDTSLLIAKELDKSGDVHTVYMAYGFGEPDALSIAAQAGQTKQPIILTDKQSVPTKTYEWLKGESLKTSYFIGGQSVIKPEIMNEMNKITTQDVSNNRLSGANRQETNAKVIEAFYPQAEMETILVAHSDTSKLVDALSAGPLAAKFKVPVLLVSNYGLESTQMSAIESKQTSHVHQIGGGIGASILNEIKEMLN